jgi:glutathione peroxidase
MYGKIDVNGADRHPVYDQLTEVADDSGEAGDIKWNFEKFLVAPNGAIVRRFRPQVTPEDPEFRAAIDEVLPA